MRKKIVVALCVSVLSATLFMTGCSSKDKKNDSDKKTESVKTDESKTEEKTSETETETTKDASNESTETTKSSEDSQESTTQNQSDNIVGDWVLDPDSTDANNQNPVATQFGTGIQMGAGLTFNADGTFSWYIGIGNGGDGTYVNENGKIAGKYTKDLDGSQQEITMNISDDEIIMNMYGDDSYFLYWKRK